MIEEKQTKQHIRSELPQLLPPFPPQQKSRRQHRPILLQPVDDEEVEDDDDDDIFGKSFLSFLLNSLRKASPDAM